MLPVRHNFLNIYRYGNGGYSEKSIRHQFSLKINFQGWFETVMSSLKNKECIAAFDPSYISKIGKKTYGKDWFWSGKDQQTKPGLEIGCLALVDVADAAAYSIEAVQTPWDMKGKLMEHYVNIVKKNIDCILSCTRYLAADGFFIKSSFIEPLLQSGLHVITRMRPDANLSYLYTRVQKTGKGRKKLYAGKVDVKNIDKRKWKSCYEDDEIKGFEIKVWCVSLKRMVKAIYVEFKNRKGYTILLITDTEQKLL